MKRLLAFLLTGLAFVPLARGTGSVYNNINGVTAPPQAFPLIDHTNFFNNNVFSITQPNGLTPYDFTSVERFTNRNAMTIYPGVRFDTVPVNDSPRHRAKHFVNANNVNGAFNNTIITGSTYLLVDATNIINRGTLATDNTGMISLQGEDVDVSRSALMVGTFGLGGLIRDDQWGFSTNLINPGANLQRNNPIVPTHTVINSDGLTNNFYSFPVNGSVLRSYWQEENPGGNSTNRTSTFIFVRTRNSSLNTAVRVAGAGSNQLGIVSVEWSIASTNPLGQTQTNFLTLFDTYGFSTTNVLLTNYANVSGFFLVDTGRRQPGNFFLIQSTYSFDFGDLVPSYTSLPGPGYFSTNAGYLDVTNQSSAWRASILSTVADPLEGSPSLTFADNVRLLPGRVELKADKFLNLNQARIQSSSYTLLDCTNSFTGASNAIISTPYADLRLGSTNGALFVTGTVVPAVRRITGTIDVYSGVWNGEFQVTATNTGTTLFNAIYVDANLTHEVQASLLDVNLRSYIGANPANKGAVTIGDTLNLGGTFSVDAGTLTVATNGVLNLQLENPDDGDWAFNVPYLQSLTNYGTITSPNGLHFYGRGLAPDGSDLPYTNFINGGTVSGSAVVINAQNLENNGVIWSFTGGTFIQAGTVTISYVAPAMGFFWAANADLSITCNDLNATNQTLLPPILAGRSLSLVVSNNLNILDNSWSVGDGFNLWVKPVTGDFNRVTVTNKAAIFANVYNTWAGEDRGTNTAGFTNNAAIGRLILNGATGSAFTFTDLQDGDGVTNALYVDVLRLEGNATNLDAGGNLANLYVTPEMKLYYSHAFFGTTEVTAGLSTKTVGGGGGFAQLAHVGAINTASSSGSGGGGSTMSEMDLGLNVQIIDSKAVISWNTIAGAVNNVYYKTTTSDEWQLLTSFVSGAGGPTSFEDPLGQEMRVYRVRVDLPTF